MIEQAVMETARGRWFLLEYARRQRAAETQRMADAVDRLEQAIETLQPQLAGIVPVAPPAPPAPAPTNETAAAVAEKLSDIVWTMRERGVGDQFCVELEKQIRIIRTLRVEIETGREQTAPPAQRLIEAPPAAAATAGPTESRAPDASNAETISLGSGAFDRAAPAPPPLQMPPPWRPQGAPDAQRPHAEPAPATREIASTRLDALPLMEKIALFC